MEESLDLGLYSRQFYVLGENAMLKMAKTSVLVYGIDGLGVEIAKNLILGGFKSVHIADSKTVSKMDLSTNYYAFESDLGRSRVASVVKKLSELNSYVEVCAHEGKLAEDYFTIYQIIVVVNQPLEDLKIYGSWARTHNTKVIFASTFGLLGQIFCDFGEGFESLDPNGREPAHLLVSHFSDEGCVYMVEESGHGLQNGCYVKFSIVNGNGALSIPIKVQVTSLQCLKIDPELISRYGLTNGDCIEAIMPQEFSFLSFEESLKYPDSILGDNSKSEYMSTYHLIFFTFGVFLDRYGRLPAIHSQSDSENFCNLVEELNCEGIVPKVDKLDMELCKLVAMQADACFGPIHGVIGGIVAQEVIKASGQKYTPLKQWFYYDCLEMIQYDGWLEKNESDFIPNDVDFFRNCGQISIFGRDFQTKIENSSSFIAGAGAIGCEILKYFALMSVACGENSTIHVTDMDSIERSNLNRQFLFRNSDIGKLKSECASSSARIINDRLNIKSYSLKVGTETESVFNSSFFKNVDCVMNALDNLEARKYVDSRCVSFLCPLIDAGTLGTFGSTQVIIPFKTEPYSVNISQKKSFPLCTLKNFPYLIEHTVQWARDKFEGLFKQTPEMLSKIMEDKEYLSKRFCPDSIDFIENVKSLHAMWFSKPESFEDCILYALKLFDDYFNRSIKQLLFNCPPEHNSSFGIPFWLPPKKCPKFIKFDAHNELHFSFVFAVAFLRACNFGIKPNSDKKFIDDIISKHETPEFEPKERLFIAETDEDEEKKMKEIPSSSVKAIINELHQQLKESVTQIEIFPLEFEKDDDTNYHIEFITACSNLRASCYGIAEMDFNQTKKIVGKIVPAIATTTAVVAAFACVEFFKVIMKFDYLEKYKNSFVNLGLLILASSEPATPDIKPNCDQDITIWDRIEVHGVTPDGKDMLLEDLLHFLKDKKYISDISMVLTNGKVIFSNFIKVTGDRLKMTVKEIYTEIYEKNLCHQIEFLTLDVFAYNLEGKDIELPTKIL